MCQVTSEPLLHRWIANLRNQFFWDLKLPNNEMVGNNKLRVEYIIMIPAYNNQSEIA